MYIGEIIQKAEDLISWLWQHSELITTICNSVSISRTHQVTSATVCHITNIALTKQEYTIIGRSL